MARRKAHTIHLPKVSRGNYQRQTADIVFDDGAHFVAYRRGRGSWGLELLSSGHVFPGMHGYVDVPTLRYAVLRAAEMRARILTVQAMGR